MIPTILTILSIFVFSACEFPSQGQVIRGNVIAGDGARTEDTSHWTDTWHEDPHDLGTATDGADIPDRDALISVDTGDPVPPTLRVCGTDDECIDEHPDNGFVCTEDGHCVHSSFSCESEADCPPDQNVCNGVKVCISGSCYLTSSPDCDDDNDWTEDFCKPREGCHHYNIECTDDSGCGEGEYCNMESRTCAPIGACTDTDDCDDGNACTYDRCLPTGCSNEPIVCYDWDPDTMDVCDPMIMCLFTEGCTTNADCADADYLTEDVCEDGFCKHICTNGECPP